MGRCDIVPTSEPSVSVPKDETTPWGTAGIQSYWDGEAHTMTQTKPLLESSTIKLHKITALVPMTDELLEDAPLLASWLLNKGAGVIDFKVTDAIVNGTGAGQPLGIRSAPCTVSQAAEGSQAADTIHGLNLVKMWARMPAGWRRNAVWLIHPDVEALLPQAGLQILDPTQSLAVGGSLLYVAAGNIARSPYASLFGRPVIPTHACAVPGDAGDIVFADLTQYAIFLRSPGLRTDTSIHLWFDQGVTAFRFTMRLGGQPWWSAAISAKNGSTTQSAFVTLESR
jgi:HK97 family phage major capsid protein